MGEISAASSEQSTGVSQVGEAVTQMDQVTQQNAALVEEMAAAASSLSHQAQALVGAVAVFKLTADQARAAQPGGGQACIDRHARQGDFYPAVHGYPRTRWQKSVCCCSAFRRQIGQCAAQAGPACCRRCGGRLGELLMWRRQRGRL